MTDPEFENANKDFINSINISLMNNDLSYLNFCLDQIIWIVKKLIHSSSKLKISSVVDFLMNKITLIDSNVDLIFKKNRENNNLIKNILKDIIKYLKLIRQTQNFYHLVFIYNFLLDIVNIQEVNSQNLKNNLDILNFGRKGIEYSPTHSLENELINIQKLVQENNKCLKKIIEEESVKFQKTNIQ